jgi:XTP/dITP diphosphohydrolase
MRGARLLFATTNQGKLHEVQLAARRFSVELYGLNGVQRKGVREPPVVSEGEPSYQANAVRKARAYAAWAGVPTLADDSGLEVEQLGGLPGVFTARFGFDRVKQLLQHQRSCDATFVCSIAYVEPGGRTVVVTKSLAGVVDVSRVADGPQGPLPYSHLFLPRGETRPLAELVTSAGYSSHRGAALAALFEALSS